MFFRAVCQPAPRNAGQRKVGRKYHTTTPATCSETGLLKNCLTQWFQHCPLQMKNQHFSAVRRPPFDLSKKSFWPCVSSARSRPIWCFQNFAPGKSKAEKGSGSVESWEYGFWRLWNMSISVAIESSAQLTWADKQAFSISCLNPRYDLINWMTFLVVSCASRTWNLATRLTFQDISGQVVVQQITGLFQQSMGPGICHHIFANHALHWDIGATHSQLSTPCWCPAHLTESQTYMNISYKSLPLSHTLGGASAITILPYGNGLTKKIYGWELQDIVAVDIFHNPVG